MMLKNPAIKKKDTDFGNYIILIIVFIINPLIGIILSAICAIKTKNYGYIRSLIILIALYLSAINSTKTPESDMRGYIDMFMRVPTNGFWKTLEYLSVTDSHKDIIYSLLVYFLYYVLFGNKCIFIFVTSFLIFYFSLKSIYRFSSQYQLPIYITVAQIITLAFFSQYFNLSAHLIRQQLAVGIFFYALSYRNNSVKRYLFGCLMAILIHSSTIIIALMGFIPFMGKRLDKKELIILSVFAISFVVMFSALGSFILSRFDLSGEAFVNASRMANMEGANDGVDSNSKVMNIMSGFMAIVALHDIVRNKPMIYPIIVNLCFLWSVLVLCLSTVPLLQYRFFFIEYNFVPFIIYLPLRFNQVLQKLESVVVVVMLMVLFYFKLNSVFDFIPIEEALLLPFPFLMQF